MPVRRVRASASRCSSHQGLQVRRLACRCCVRCAGGLTASGDLGLVEGEYELINRVEEENATEAAASVSAALPTGGFVILDTALDADLLAEGYARDVIRSVQDARKAADLDRDRIALVLTVPAVNVADVEQFKDLIARETLATSFEVKEGAELAVEVAKA